MTEQFQGSLLICVSFITIYIIASIRKWRDTKKGRPLRKVKEWSYVINWGYVRHVKKWRHAKHVKKMKERMKQRHDSTQARKVCGHVKHVGT